VGAKEQSGRTWPSIFWARGTTPDNLLVAISLDTKEQIYRQNVPFAGFSTWFQGHRRLSVRLSTRLKVAENIGLRKKITGRIFIGSNFLAKCKTLSKLVEQQASNYFENNQRTHRKN
jgi:hypothetical protein